MTPNAASPRLKTAPVVLTAMIVVAALTRLLPHPPNFAPMEAMALFGGAWFAARHWALVVPLAAMLISDLALAGILGGDYAAYMFTFDHALVYASIVAITLLGFALRGRVTGTRLLGYSLAGSVLFFLVTNLGSWLALPIYPATPAGLLAAYAAGIPFFQWTVLGTLFYSAILFGGFALLRRQWPTLRAQTA
ncbi:MAG: DUF6580 family putative transport protein [Xanthomonadaceae bacterium]|nr:DUF6580 family putative transport protein [Xanthomonadaceae bacterium]